MVAVNLVVVGSSVPLMLLSMATLVSLGGIALIESPVWRRFILATMVALMLAVASSAYAVPYNFCDPLWKWMGWC